MRNTPTNFLISIKESKLITNKRPKIRAGMVRKYTWFLDLTRVDPWAICITDIEHEQGKRIHKTSG